MAKRFEAQRWHVEEVDEEDHLGLRRALDRARAETERPSLIITRTTIGLGSPNKAGTSKAHGEKLGADEVRLTKEACGWPLQPEFLIPDDVKAYLKSDPGRVERNKVNVGNIGYRLVQENQKEYVGQQAAKWKMILNPRQRHLDKRVTITTPLQRPGV